MKANKQTTIISLRIYNYITSVHIILIYSYVKGKFYKILNMMYTEIMTYLGI